MRLSLLMLTLALAWVPAALGEDASPAPGAVSRPTEILADVSAVAADDPGSPLPANWQNGPFIEIYVRGYKDSDGDGIGDLKGLTQSLDYLKDLGVAGIWLMPVTASQDRDHGYAVSDYRNIEPDYGTLADFDNLIKEAHARGIGVIIDYVMNHSAATNPLFISSRSSTAGPFRDWYVWEASKPSGWRIYARNPWHSANTGYYFASFSNRMPEFDLRNARVISYHRDNLRFWLNRGVDGFRFDAVGNLVENGPNAWEIQSENYAIMGGIRGMLDTYAQRFMVCEVPADPIGFSAGSVCRSAFAFGHHKDIVDAARGRASAIRSAANYFKTAPITIATMASNHDTFAGERLYDQIGGNLAQYRLVAATYLLQPGVPFIYYGEEIGMSGNPGLAGDRKLRTPMSWTGNTGNGGFTTGTPFRALSGNVASHNVASQQQDPDSLFNFYKTLIALRRALPSLAAGAYVNVNVDGDTMTFQRVLGDERAVVAINYGSSAATIVVGGLPPGAVLSSGYPAGAGSVTASGSGIVRISLPAQSFSVHWNRN